MLKRRICEICEDPKGFIPKHYRNIVCYKAKCREIYKERQKQRKLITQAEWRSKQKPEPIFKKQQKVICEICEDPVGFIPKHWKAVCCYKESCRTIYEEQQRISQLKLSDEWRKKKYRGTCTRCKRRMKGSGLCKQCISILSSVFADPSLTEGGCFPSEVSLWVPTAEMEYGKSNYSY